MLDKLYNVKYNVDEMLYDVKAPLDKNSVIGKLKLSYDNNTYKALYNFALHEIVCMPTVDVLNKIRAEIERLHYHPKLDFIKNDEVVEMALDIIDKYKAESEVSDADSD